VSKSIEAAASLRGDITLPPDKSIAHRTALFAALADGTSHIVHFPKSADPRSTLACLQSLGIEIEEDESMITVHGRGLRGFRRPDGPLDCGNSGTTMRLLTGILAGQDFETTLVGDASLQSRDMGRIAKPLQQMGAQIELTDGHAPITVRPSEGLRGMQFDLPIASAQVKSCILLAGLYADGETEVIERIRTRDHTERMLGLDVIDVDGVRHISSNSSIRVEPRTWSVPGDFSASAFFLVAGTIIPDSEIILRAVGINPSRAALLDVLRAMGADIQVKNERDFGGEPIADLVVRSAELAGVSVRGELIPNLIDEIPILAVAALFADGETVIRDAEELRHKECDRIAVMVSNLQALGGDITEYEDGLAIRSGKSLRGTAVKTHGDHRIAMAMAVAGLMVEGTTTIDDPDCAAVSFPGFFEVLESLRQ
jgi:3-phosphoshikimate 1-carboxyvinyltransferase